MPTTRYKRYAIFYTPEPNSDLARLGTHWFGWDADQGTDAQFLNIDGLPKPIEELTSGPRRYGLHGTLKAPFYLRDGYSPLDLHHATQALAYKSSPVSIVGLGLSTMHGFLSLRPRGDIRPLDSLAQSVVRGLDQFREALQPDERSRRLRQNLNADQILMLDEWGYPYVMEEFRFHLTLTPHLPRPELEALRRHLAPIIEPNLPHPLEIRELSLCGEMENGQFRVVQRYPLGGVRQGLNTHTRSETGEPMLADRTLRRE